MTLQNKERNILISLLYMSLEYDLFFVTFLTRVLRWLDEELPFVILNGKDECLQITTIFCINNSAWCKG